MGETTGISWCDSTWNPVTGCVKISDGCLNCYASTLSERNLPAVGKWGANALRKFAAESSWRNPIKWDRAAREAGEIRTVFCASLADLFEGEHIGQIEGRWGPRPDYLPMLHRMRELAAVTPNLVYLMLSKRPWNQVAYAKECGWPTNWWQGISVENQDAADTRLVETIPGANVFLSCEPLIGSVVIPGIERFAWVIGGGESGSNARPCHPAWARSLRDQCGVAGVPFHWKQWGEWGHSGILNFDPEQRVFREFHSYNHWIGKARTWLGPDDACLDAKGRRLMMGADFMRARDEDAFPVTILSKLGKHAAGRLLDGTTYDATPAAKKVT